MQENKLGSDYQSVTLVFNNGQEYTYFGPAYVRNAKDMKVVRVLFSEPKPLPSGSYFEEIS